MTARTWWDKLPRPLDPLASFKVKTTLLVGSAITLAAFTFWLGASWQFRWALLAALTTSMLFVQFLAHGMTSPAADDGRGTRDGAWRLQHPGARHHATRSVSSRRRSTRWPRISVRPTSIAAA